MLYLCLLPGPLWLSPLLLCICQPSLLLCPSLSSYLSPLHLAFIIVLLICLWYLLKCFIYNHIKIGSIFLSVTLVQYMCQWKPQKGKYRFNDGIVKSVSQSNASFQEQALVYSHLPLLSSCPPRTCFLFYPITSSFCFSC